MIASGTSAELKASLGSSAIVVEFAAPDRAGRARDLLRRLGEGVEADAAGNRVEIGVRDPAGALVEAVRLLDDAGLPPMGLRIREPTLDDVFLALTGRTSAAPSTAGRTAATGEDALA